MCVCVCSDLKLRVRILIDGTLIIYRVKPEDAGKYTCSPSNSLGISPSASAYLTVQCECCYGEGGGGRGGCQGAMEQQQQHQASACIIWLPAAPSAPCKVTLLNFKVTHHEEAAIVAVPPPYH